MVAKNYLLFIIDSLNYSHIEESPIALMPFFSQLKKSGITCDNMYSQAPYTEAAVMNLYCGQDVLQDGGYLFRFKTAQKTIFEAMREHGYKTYFNSYQPQCHPSSVRRGVDYLYYNVGFDQGALWSYRFQHYSELFKAGQLTEHDYSVLKELLEDNFSEWLRFIDDIVSHDESTNMIADNAPLYRSDEVRQGVEAEYSLYKRGKEAYIKDLLSKGESHSLFRLPAYVQTDKIHDRNQPIRVKEEMTPLFKRIRSMNVKLNSRNARGVFKGPIKKLGRFLCHPNKTTYKEFLKSSYLAVNEIRDIDLFQRINEDCDCFKNAPSGRTHIDHYLRWAEQHKGDGKHFACIHIDDIHNPEVFFTYDSNDMDLIRTERLEAEELLDLIPKTYYGSLTHDLSLRYIDNVLKYLYTGLEKRGMLEDTCIVICADHGFSFSGNPIRDSFVVNLYLENYKIPCVITGSGFEHKEIKELRTSKDIPATLCKLATGEIPEGFSGHSLTEDYDYPEVQIEYCGGGCPDLTRREIKLAAFDKTYFVGTLCKLDDKLDEKKITEIYNLENDPKQLHNLKNASFDRQKVNSFLIQIEKRRNDIKSSMKIK